MNPQESLEDEDKIGEREPEKEEICIGQFHMNINCIRDKPQMLLLFFLFSMIFRKIKVA
jgi:hypothetical protein